MIQIGGVYTTVCQREGILVHKYRDRNGRCIAILFQSIRVRGRFDSPELHTCLLKHLEGVFSYHGPRNYYVNNSQESLM